jgi:rhodanese-related sulfurtransferase
MRLFSLVFIAFFGCLSANANVWINARRATTRVRPYDIQPTMSSAYDAMLRGLLSFSVPTITCAQLNTAQKTEKIVLLDAREPKEYAVSHLAGAQNVGYDDFSIKNLKKLPKNAQIVVYCSVGYRSEKVGEKLQKAGYKNVKNLYGSIFEWVNEGFTVVDATEKPTENVHAFSKIWGVWLRKGRKVY